MKLQNIYLHLYRIIGFIFLAGLVCAILWYALSVLFFSSNSNWSIPLVLSPTQDKVIGHLSQVSSFEQNLSKQKIELMTNAEELKSKEALLESTMGLNERLSQSMNAQAQRYAHAGQDMAAVLNEKQNAFLSNKGNLNAAQASLKNIDRELRLGLITKQQAASQRLSLYALSSTMINDKAQIQQLKTQTGEMASAANTLSGGDSNLAAIVSVSQGAELNIKLVQLKNDILKLKASNADLEKNIASSDKTLEGLKDSPYLLAIRHPTNVIFVPYENMGDVHEGAPIYTCYLKMIFCAQSGQITRVYEAEEYARHPMFKTDLKGRFVGVNFEEEKDAQKDIAFIDHRPLLF